MKSQLIICSLLFLFYSSSNAQSSKFDRSFLSLKVTNQDDSFALKHMYNDYLDLIEFDGKKVRLCDALTLQNFPKYERMNIRGRTDRWTDYCSNADDFLSDSIAVEGYMWNDWVYLANLFRFGTYSYKQEKEYNATEKMLYCLLQAQKKILTLEGIKQENALNTLYRYYDKIESSLPKEMKSNVVALVALLEQ